MKDRAMIGQAIRDYGIGIFNKKSQSKKTVPFACDLNESDGISEVANEYNSRTRS